MTPLLNLPVQFLFNIFKPERQPSTSWIQVGDKSVPLLLVHNPRSKRYVLRLKPDGTARITIPRGSSQRKARAFAEKNVEWIKRQMQSLIILNLFAVETFHPGNVASIDSKFGRNVSQSASPARSSYHRTDRRRAWLSSASHPAACPRKIPQAGQCPEVSDEVLAG